MKDVPHELPENWEQLRATQVEQPLQIENSPSPQCVKLDSNTVVCSTDEATFTMHEFAFDSTTKCFRGFVRLINSKQYPIPCYGHVLDISK
jgi:hypothetical protein